MSDGAQVTDTATATDTPPASPMGSAGAKPPAAGLAPPPDAVTDTTVGTDTAPSKTLADGVASDDTTSRARADWPDDWRARLAGEDAKALKRLERFGSPLDVFKSFRELEAKLSSGKSGQKAAALSPDATEEEIAEYRKEHGIPETPDKYDTQLGDGFVWGEADKPLLEDYTKWAHERNMTPQAVKENLAWYASLQTKQAEAREVADEQFRATAEDALRKEWGPEFRRNLNAMGSMFESMPEDQRAALWVARLPNGRLLGDDPAYVKFWAGLARELNPAATLIPGGGNDPIKGVEGRMQEIQKLMGDQSSAYWRGPEANKLQAEYRELIEASQKLKSRAAA